MTTTVQTGSNSETRPLWPLFFGIIDQPTKTFQAILARRSWATWLIPLLAILLCFAVFIIVQTPYNLELARTQAESQLAQFSPEQAEAARAGMEMSMSIPFMLVTGLGFGALALLMGLLVQATFFYFGALIAGGDDLNFGPIFTMSVWTRIPAAIGFLTMTGFIAFTQHSIQYPGLAFLVATGDIMQDARNPWVGLLSGIDLFWLWQLWLIVVGLAVTARFGRGKALILTLVYAALSLGLTVLPSLLFGGMMGG